MKYIKLHRRILNNAIYIACNTIVSFERNYADNFTEIKIAYFSLVSSGEVIETPIEILKLIAECEDN